jgi:GTP 3',8-cyclase
MLNVVQSYSAMTLAPTLRSLPPLGETPSTVRRVIDYMRISITDRCNQRCLYCYSENFNSWSARKDLLTAPEIISVVRSAAELGVRHIRLTGGEPLMREDVLTLIKQLKTLPGIESVQLTTNGNRLTMMADDLYEAGLRRINISLDALNPSLYRAITRSDVTPVLDGIRRVKELGFESVKLNTVLMRGRNQHQLMSLVHFAAEYDIPIRFIELLPVSFSEMLDEQNFLSIGEVRAELARHDSLVPVTEFLGHGPATYYRLPEIGATVGFIGALTDLHFCDSCNKLRLTADGKLRPCLGNHIEYDLKPVLRPAIDPAAIRMELQTAIKGKPLEHLFRDHYQPKRIMTAIGG